MNFCLLQIQPESGEGWKLGDHMEVAGPIVVIALFLIERLISNREKKKERRSNWYYSVVVVPNIKCINDFFHDYTTSARSSLTQFANESSPGNETRLNNIKMIRFAELSELIREFEQQFLMTLYLFNTERYEKLMGIVNEMRDEVLKILDKFQISDNPGDEISRIISQKKSIFFNQLYLAIQDKG